ncbi:response regulator [Mucilaginibacter paludis]|uniref:Response regulator receiver n=1 Tax=Mucilaginibacter paludis DSM 18603 TaxID=714943 RepID=H1YAA9_9SPHI|nr:response regulator [Mucilaginibacter paludis]EHQ26952.1 response regulator receiver [Mucilaginibacter paludis DSM 18603]
MESKCYNLCLLIDDNFIDNFVTRKILESGNFAKEIVVYQSAPEAIQALKDKKIVPDVIFLDIRMPLMDGFAFLDEYDKLVIDHKQDIKIFMLSSSLDPVDFRLSTQNKYITQFIHKPITHKVLEAICI